MTIRLPAWSTARLTGSSGESLTVESCRDDGVQSINPLPMRIHEIEIAARPDGASGDVKKAAREFFHLRAARDDGRRRGRLGARGLT